MLNAEWAVEGIAPRAVLRCLLVVDCRIALSAVCNLHACAVEGIAPRAVLRCLLVVDCRIALSAVCNLHAWAVEGWSNETRFRQKDLHHSEKRVCTIQTKIFAPFKDIAPFKNSSQICTFQNGAKDVQLHHSPPVLHHSKWCKSTLNLHHSNSFSGQNEWCKKGSKFTSVNVPNIQHTCPQYPTPNTHVPSTQHPAPST